MEELKSQLYSNIQKEYNGKCFLVFWKNPNGVININEILKFEKLDEKNIITEVESEAKAWEFVNNMELLKSRIDIIEKEKRKNSNKRLLILSGKTINKILKAFELCCELLTKTKQFEIFEENVIQFECEHYTTKPKTFVLIDNRDYISDSRYTLTIDGFLTIFLNTEQYVRLRSFGKNHFEWLQDIENNETGTLEFVRSVNEINKNK